MKKLAYGFLTIGLVLIVLSIVLTSFSNIKYNNLVNSFEENLSNIHNLENIKDDLETDSDNITEDMIGLIKIPVINLKYPILEGTNTKVLKQAIGHFEVSALPGETGNMTLIGHNNFILAEPFKNLDKLSVGDIVTITTTEQDYTYQVTKSYTVDPYNTNVVKQGNKTKLTLITCTNNSQKRLVVEALLSDTTIDNNNKEE